MRTILLKEQCVVCGGKGCIYAVSSPHDVPCDRCRGRGYVRRVLFAPDPKWAQQYDAEVRRIADGKIVGECE